MAPRIYVRRGMGLPDASPEGAAAATHFVAIVPVHAQPLQQFDRSVECRSPGGS
eukprot:CAMPEP_0171242400 /NCGR_PEP_ID=MMETSP0790-20130122/45666_1 /TAXON_ID=2925 /ORGANISM="Alexandrium catenella, Strain OF101" /LENGTH=53 /DNA_ID=CAMNT_0011709189 /DNA_START=127 /DNA_END=285 /DNA_ORIENTATION=-